MGGRRHEICKPAQNGKEGRLVQFPDQTEGFNLGGLQKCTKQISFLLKPIRNLSLSLFFVFLIQQCCSLLPAHQILSYQGQQVIQPGYPYLHPRGGSGNQDASRFSNPGFQQSEGGHPFGSANDCCNGLQQRVNFVVPDPSKYDASINLQNVQISDSATYECKVKKTTVATRKVTVMVLGE